MTPIQDILCEPETVSQPVSRASQKEKKNQHINERYTRRWWIYIYTRARTCKKKKKEKYIQPESSGWIFTFCSILSFLQQASSDGSRVIFNIYSFVWVLRDFVNILVATWIEKTIEIIRLFEPRIELKTPRYFGVQSVNHRSRQRPRAAAKQQYGVGILECNGGRSRPVTPTKHTMSGNAN